MSLSRVSLWLIALGLAWSARPVLADAPPLMVVALDAALDPNDASSIVLRALATQPDGHVVTRELGRVSGECTIDVGGVESLSVARCSLASGDLLELEILQLGPRVFVDTYPLTELDEATRRPTITRHTVAVTDHAWGEPDREDDGWLRLAPTPMTLAIARTSSDVRIAPIAGRPVAFRDTDAGALTYRFDAQGRTTEIHWDPQADSREYLYMYRYACR